MNEQEFIDHERTVESRVVRVWFAAMIVAQVVLGALCLFGVKMSWIVSIFPLILVWAVPVGLLGAYALGVAVFWSLKTIFSLGRSND